MKKFFLSIVLALLSMTAHAEIWYYIQSGNEPEAYIGPIIVVVRDNNGQLWRTDTALKNIQSILLRIKNKNYYIDVFNSGIVGGTWDRNGDPVAVPNGDDPYTRYCKHSVLFRRLDVEQRTSKCYVLNQPYTRFNGQICYFEHKIALSLDYKTLVYNCEDAHPVYYTSVPIERFIVRKSVDDLF